MKPGKIFVISSPSGCGKTTIVKKVIKKIGNIYDLHVVVTYTTRPPRTNEISGRDYHFLSPEDFENKKNTGFFLETTQYNGEWYGSPASVLEQTKQGKSFIFVIEQKGAQSLIKKLKVPVLIWILPPNLEALEQRLRKRGTETEKHLTRRLDIARQEIEFEEKNKIFNHWIVNDNLDQAVQEVRVILETELQKI
ncbi:MAG: guanylate kinase [bacterium]